MKAKTGAGSLRTGLRCRNIWSPMHSQTKVDGPNSGVAHLDHGPQSCQLTFWQRCGQHGNWRLLRCACTYWLRRPIGRPLPSSWWTVLTWHIGERWVEIVSEMSGLMRMWRHNHRTLVSREPYSRTRTISKFAYDLVSLSQNLCQTHRIVTRGNVIRHILLFNLLGGRYSNKVGIGEIKWFPAST